MKRILLSALLLASSHIVTMAQPTFARGADISWYSEMMKDGKYFYNVNGQQTEINALMKECGMNAIRLRVWVEPSLGIAGSSPFAGGWCGTDDTVQKALAAKAQGMDVLIDFHYSDFFADPSRQCIPAAWQGSTLDQLAQHVAEHTTAVLSALKAAGVTPRWVQLGNETRNGMLYSQYNASSHTWYDATGVTGSTNAAYGGGWANYARLSNAGYDAAKAVFSDVICMCHLDTRASDEDLSWWFKAFKEAGGRLDMVGLSHYPMPWNGGGETAATTSGKSRNEGLMRVISNTYKTVQVPIMIVETGVYCEYLDGGRAVMQDLFDKSRARDYIRGVFYWEPEQYNWWKPAIYTTIGWSNYNMCAFLSNGRPSSILDPWQPTDAEREHEAGIAPVLTDTPVSRSYDLQGRICPTLSTEVATRGIRIEAGRKTLRFR